MRISAFTLAMLVATAGISASLPVDLRADDAAFVEWVTGETIQISLQQITDSRCAKGAICVWEGEVDALLSLTVNGVNVGEAQVTLPGRDDKKAVALVEGYAIRLVDVAPYPVLDVVTDLADYLVKLEIYAAGQNNAHDLKGKWQLQSLGIEGERFAVLPETELTMVIDVSDDRFGFAQGTGGCNAFSASVDVGENGSVALADLGFTDMACGAPAGIMDQEERFYETLETVTSFAVDASQLRLFGGKGSLFFAPADVATAVGNSTWGQVKGRIRAAHSD